MALEDEAVQIELSQVDRSYNWYKVVDLQGLIEIPVPDFKTGKNILRYAYRLFRTKSQDYLRQPRDMQTIEFRGSYISLEASEGYKYEGNLGIMRLDNVLYLGVKENAG